MTKVIPAMDRSLRRRLPVALACAVTALGAAAIPAGAASQVERDCKPTDAVCPNTAAKKPGSAPAAQAPSPAPADQTKTTPPKKVKPVSIPEIETSFWDDLSNFALTWGPLIF